MTDGRVAEKAEAAPPILGDFIYREGNVYRLNERREDLWVWDIGILAQKGDQEALGVTTDLLEVKTKDGMEKITPGHFYWLLQANIPHNEVARTVLEWAVIKGRLTATSEELYRDLQTLVEDLQNVTLDDGDGKTYTLNPKALEMVRSALLPPGEETRSESPKNQRLPKVKPVLDNGFAIIPSSAPFETMIQGIQNAAAGAFNWDDSETTTVPTYRRLMGRTGKTGTIDLSIRLQDGEALERNTMLSILWNQVRELDDLTADVLIAAVTQWLDHQDEGSTWITADAILDYRGIKPITKKEGGFRRRAGHHIEHKASIARAFEQLDHLWLNINNMDIIELEGKRRRPTKLSLESKALAISDRISQGGLGGGHLPVAWYYRPGQWAMPFLQEGFRQTALLTQQSLQYDPYHETWEKRISRYLAFHWRIQAHRANYAQPYRVDTLLKAISMQPNRGRPHRTRERLEKALDRLQTDAGIASWEYRKGDEETLPMKGWLPTWLGWTVVVTPPLQIVHHYAKITKSTAKTQL